MTQNVNPDPEDPNPLDEDEGQQSRMIEPASEDYAPPKESEDHLPRRVEEPGPQDDDPLGEDEDDEQQSRQVDPGPEDDDPPEPKRPRIISFFRSLWHMLARLFHRP